MLSLDQFESLAVDDVVETLGLWPKLDPNEPVKFRVKTKEADKAVFAVTYFGVTVGLWTCLNKGGVLIWQ